MNWKLKIIQTTNYEPEIIRIDLEVFRSIVAGKKWIKSQNEWGWFWRIKMVHLFFDLIVQIEKRLNGQNNTKQ